MISILIVAAGASRRMGRQKQLLKWKNTTLIGHSIEQAIASSAENVHVVLGSNYATIENAIKSYPINILRFNEWEKGMGNTIAYSIKTLVSGTIFDAAAGSAKDCGLKKGILIMLADQPQVSTEYLNKLIKAFYSQPKGIVATHYNDQGDGVPAIFAQRYFNHLISLKRDKGAKQIIRNSRHDVFSMTPKKAFIDIDTYATYLSMHSLIGK